MKRKEEKIFNNDNCRPGPVCRHDARREEIFFRRRLAHIRPRQLCTGESCLCLSDEILGILSSAIRC